MIENVKPSMSKRLLSILIDVVIYFILMFVFSNFVFGPVITNSEDYKNNYSIYEERLLSSNLIAKDANENMVFVYQLGKMETKEDFIKNGMIPELVGRFNIIVQMNELDYNSLLEILNRAKNSVLNTQKEFFKKREIDLIVEEAAKKAIALKASNNNLGARSLDEIIETALSEASLNSH